MCDTDILSVVFKEETSEGDVSLSTEQLRACRACLATDRKLFNIHTNRLAGAYGELIGTPVMIADGLPQHLCYVCSALLQKGSSFKDKCRSAHYMLQGILARQLPLTTKYIRSVSTLHLQTCYHKSSPYIVDIGPDDHFTQNVKSDSDSEVDNDDFFVTYSADDDEVLLKSEDIKPPEPSISELIIDNKSKEDIEPNYHEDDQPLSERRRTSKRIRNHEKEETVEKVKSKRIKKEREHKEVEVKKKDVKSKKENVKSKKENVKSKKENVKSKKDNKKIKMELEDQNEAAERDFNVEILYLNKEEQLSEFQARKETSSFKDATYKCEYCYKGFVKESAFKNHMEVHDPSTGKHMCEICHTYFDRDGSYRRHMSLHKKRLKCKHSNCGFISKSTTEAKLHYNWHNGVKFDCKQCGTIYNKRSTYMTHLRKLHGSTFCSICSEPFLGEQGLRAHMLKAHRKAVEYRCSTCGVQFLSSDAFHRHVATAPSTGCKDVRPCEHCGVNLATEDLFLEHLQTEHEMKLRCDMCGLIFKNELLCKKHCYKVHGEGRGRPLGSTDKGTRPRPKPGKTGPKKPGAECKELRFMCEMCGRYFPSNAVLKEHQRIHTGEKPFQCSVCSKRFRIKELLRLHMNSHTGETPHKCPHCPKAFSCASNRDRHLLVHTKERRYPCPLCGRMFQQSCYVKIHIRTAHLKEPWPKRSRH